MQVISVRITDITVLPGRYRKDMGDLPGLAASMKEKQLAPIGLNPARHLIFGERRLEAAKLNGASHIFAAIFDLDNPLFGEHEENEQRKPFTPSEKVAIAREFERQIGERRGNPELAASNSGQLAGIGKGKETRDAAAEKAGFNSTSEYRRAAVVVDKGTPELVAAVDAGDVTVSAAAEVAKLPKDEQAATVAAGPMAVKDRAAEERQARKEQAGGGGSAPADSQPGEAAPAGRSQPHTSRPMPHETRSPAGRPRVKGVGGEIAPWATFDRAYGPLVRAVDDYFRIIAKSNGRDHREAQDIAGKLLHHMTKVNKAQEAKS